LAAAAALPATARTAGAAAAQAPVLPLAGATPAVAATGDPTAPLVFAYTGSDKHAYEAPLASPASAQSLGGTLVGGPGLDLIPALSGTPWAFTEIYARGSNNQLYRSNPTTPWYSLGGGLTARPGVAAGALSIPGGFAIDVVVRGYDGSTYLSEIPTRFGWMYLGGPGRTLAGSGPAAVNVGGTLYVLVLAADGSVWVRHSTDPSTNWSDWKSLGGRGSGDVGVASPAPGVGVVFVRGTDGAAWYNEFAGTTAGVTPGWHSLGGQLTSGVGAGSAPGGSTAVLVLGPNGRIYLRTETWPALGTWTRLF
jgi:hypothetical protein